MERESGVPAYDEQLSGFHHAFARELEHIVQTLPLAPGMRVLDLACGDGFYTRHISRRLGRDGVVTGVDVNRTYLAAARRAADRDGAAAQIELVTASFDRLPFDDGTFDFVWCAQSLYSLPEPVAVLGHVARVLRPGGILAVLENDTMHQVFLPWPARLALPLRTAELRSLERESRHPSKFYVGRHLPASLAPRRAARAPRSVLAAAHAPPTPPHDDVAQRAWAGPQARPRSDVVMSGRHRGATSPGRQRPMSSGM